MVGKRTFFSCLHKMPPPAGGARAARQGRAPQARGAAQRRRRRGGTQGRLRKAIIEPVILAPSSFSRTKTLACATRALRTDARTLDRRLSSRLSSLLIDSIFLNFRALFKSRFYYNFARADLLIKLVVIFQKRCAADRVSQLACTLSNTRNLSSDD